MGYPKAALFAFCLTLLAYNAVSLIKAALRSKHGRKKINDDASGYDLSLEIARTYDGMMIALPAPHWQFFRELSDQEFGIFHERGKVVNSLFGESGRIAEFGSTNCQLGFERAQEFAEALRELASSVKLSRYQKHPRGPKKKPPERTPYENGKHVSTAKLLASR